MINFFSLCFWLLSVAAQNIPSNEKSFDKEVSLFATKKIENHFISFKAAHIFQDKQSDRNILELGYRYGLENWRMGVSLAREKGHRHNEDWMMSSGRWGWLDTSSRSETLARSFIQHKFFLWNKGILKNRMTLQHNFFNDQDTLLLTSGILWFGKGNHTFLHQFEVFLPLNFNRSLISEIWHYSGFMWKASQNISLGPRLSLGYMKWNESLAFKGRTGESFNQELFIVRLGLGVFYHF